MSNLTNAIRMLEGCIERRSGPYSRPDSTVLTKEEGETLLNMLRVHAAQEETIQWDIERSGFYDRPR